MLRVPANTTAKPAALAALAACALGIAPGSAAHAQTGERALPDYVTASDPAYEWRERARYERGTTEIVELRLHSQTWRGTLWKHRLFLIRPERVATADNAFLIIGGGRWSEADESPEPPEQLPDDAEDFLAMAEAMETVVAVLGTVPFQPLLGRTEDELIAYTFDRYLRDRDPTWPLLLPMVKSTTSAMDAVQSAAAQIWGRPIERFTVAGGSKRGWTAWLTAAVDDRVAAFAPLVFDALDMAAHFPHQTAAWGQPSIRIAPYTDLGLHEALDSDEGAALRRIVDPYAYLDEILQPKLVINATNDEYFPIDSLNLYWSALEGPKYAAYVPNQRHSIDELELVVPSINALHRAVSGGTPLPQMSWEYAPREAGGLTLCLRATPAPARVVYWRADSTDRDFRDERWTPTPLESSGPAHTIDLDRPASGYTAVYADLRFDHAEAPYYLSTTPAILGAPGTEQVGPPPADHGDACTGLR